MVSIKVDLNTGAAHTKIEALRAHLGTIGDGDDFDFDLDGFLDDLDDVDANLDNILRQMKQMRNNEADDLFASLGIDGAGGGGGGSTNDGKSSGNDPPSRREHWLSRIFRILDTGQGSGYSVPGGHPSGRGGRRTAASRIINRDLSPGPDAPISAFRRHRRGVEIGRFAGKFSRLKGVLNRLKPSMKKIWNLIALIAPMMVTLATAAFGVAAAFAAVAVAGAAMLGLGLLGGGDDWASSLENARSTLQDFASDLYNVFEPAMDIFQPISERFFDFAPGELFGFSRAIQNLTVFEDTVFAAFSGFADWLTVATNGIAENEQAISQLAMRFGEMLGTGILDFFGYLLQYASKNQNFIIELAGAFKQIGLIIINLSEIFSRLAIAIRPVLTIVLWLSRTFNNRLGAALIMIFILVAKLGGPLLMLINWFMKVRMAAMMLQITTVTAFRVMAVNALRSISAMIAGLSALQAAMAATGIGLAIVAGGYLMNELMPDPGGDMPSGSSFGSGGGTSPSGSRTTYNTEINNYGNMEEDQVQSIRDELGRQRRRDDATNLPSTDGTMETSNTENN
jgi:hypothetical protein